jgi:cation diffusion facilitator CzcD-associated flavoprotein CzcO
MERSGPRVVIIGGGFGGIGAAIELQSHGFTDITLLERGEALGGTWLYNSYPGCACDVPSHLYSFSFAQRRDWKRLCSTQAEILEYLQGVAHDYGVERIAETGVEIADVSYDDASRDWTVKAGDGRSWEADAVVIASVSCTGRPSPVSTGSRPSRERPSTRPSGTTTST